MKWNEYESNYIRMAKLQDKTEEYCILQLEYAKKLFDQNLPIIYNQEHLCRLLGYNQEYVYAACNGAKKFYRQFTVDKKMVKSEL